MSITGSVEDMVLFDSSPLISVSISMFSLFDAGKSILVDDTAQLPKNSPHYSNGTCVETNYLPSTNWHTDHSG